MLGSARIQFALPRILNSQKDCKHKLLNYTFGSRKDNSASSVTDAKKADLKVTQKAVIAREEYMTHTSLKANIKGRTKTTKLP